MKTLTTLTLACLTALQASTPSTSFSILQPGQGEDSSMSRDRSGWWLALSREGDHWILRKVRVISEALMKEGQCVNPYDNPYQPSSPLPAGYYFYWAPELKEAPIAFLRGLPVPVDSARRMPGSKGSVDGGTIQRQESLPCLGKPLVLWGEAGASGSMRVHLSWGGKSQTLFRADFQDEGNWRLLWAGDLDGDGRPDLILEASPKYSVSVLRLYLSSQSGPEKLVKEVATATTVGP